MLSEQEKDLAESAADAALELSAEVQRLKEENAGLVEHNQRLMEALDIARVAIANVRGQISGERDDL